MRSVAILIIVLTALKGYGNKYILKLYLNSDACYSCELGLRELRNLNTNITLEIICGDADKAVISEYLQRFDLISSKYKLVSGKIKSNSKSKGSWAAFYLRNKEIVRFDISESLSYVKGINHLVSRADSVYCIKRFDSETFSETSNCFVDGSTVCVTDTKLGKVVLYNYIDSIKSIRKIDIIRGADFNYIEFLRLGRLDTSFYSSFKEEVLKRGVNPLIENSYIHKNTLWSLLAVPYYHLKDSNTIRRELKLFMIRMDLASKSISKYFVQSNGIYADSNNYFLDNSQSFSVRDSFFRFFLFSPKYQGSRARIFVDYMLNADTLKFKRLCPLVFETKRYLKQGLETDYTFINSNYHLFAKNQLVINSQTYKSLKMEVQKVGYLSDVKVVGAFVWAIYIDKKDEVKLFVFDKNTGKPFRRMDLKFSSKVLPLSVKFTDQGYVFALSADQKSVFIQE